MSLKSIQNRSPVTCRQCGTPNLYWQKVAGKWKLHGVYHDVSSSQLLVHTCPVHRRPSDNGARWLAKWYEHCYWVTGELVKDYSKSFDCDASQDYDLFTDLNNRPDETT
jgi:hypothetical protein